MESAIPVHLRAQCPRHRRVPDDYTPPYPSYVARHAESVTQVVMAYFGVQFRDTPSQHETAHAALTQLEEDSQQEEEGGEKRREPAGLEALGQTFRVGAQQGNDCPDQQIETTAFNGHV